MADVEEGEERAFEVSTLNEFMAQKDVVEGIIQEIVNATDVTLQLLEEAANAFDPAREAEISSGLVRCGRPRSLCAVAVRFMCLLFRFYTEFGYWFSNAVPPSRATVAVPCQAVQAGVWAREESQSA